MRLALADSEHLGAADGANTLGGWPGILHGDGFRVLHLSFCPALDAVSLHFSPLAFSA